MEANAFLEALYNANYERLYIYAENLLFNAAYAEEAVQETFFEAVRKQDALMRHAKPEAWLMETLKNKIRVGSRRRALEALYFISLEQDLAQAEQQMQLVLLLVEIKEHTAANAFGAPPRPAAAGGLSSALPHHAGRSNASGGCQGARHLGLEQPETAAAHPQKALQAAFAK